MREERGQKGQSLAELAVVLPLLLLILLGLIDLGRVFHAFIVVENAAREGARYGASHPGVLAAAAAAAVAEAEGAGIAPVSPSVRREGDVIQATVSFEFRLISGFLGIGPITITGTAQMPVLTAS